VAGDSASGQGEPVRGHVPFEHVVLDVAARTHVGLVRTANEDHFATRADLGIVVVADGMGGHRAGDVAAQMAVDIIQAELTDLGAHPPADAMESLMRIGQAIESANASIFRLGRIEPKLSGMGTTAVVTLFLAGRLFYAHVGDSRLYRLRNGKLKSLTRDHSLVQELLDLGFFRTKGEALAAGVGENVITRCLGLDITVDVDLGEASVAPGDLFLCCTDGLFGQVTDQEIARILLREDLDLEARADALLSAALATGGRDNITLVLAQPA